MEKIIATPKRMMWLVAACVMMLLVAFGASSSILKASEDSTPPELTAFSLSPTTVNTENGDETLTLEVTLTDDLSGVCIFEDCGEEDTGLHTQLTLVPEAGGDQFVWFLSFTRTSGDELDGTYEATATLPKGAMNGNWTVDHFVLRDRIGNERQMDAAEIAEVPGASGVTINNEASTFDDEAPVLTAFSLSPTSFSTEVGTQDFTLELSITDNLSGVCTTEDCGSFDTATQSQMLLKHASGQELWFNDLTLDSGDDLSGDYIATATMPQHAASGEWVVDYLLLGDKVGNERNMDAAEIAAVPGAAGTTVTNTSTVDDTTAPNVTSFSLTPVEVNTESEDQVLELEITLTDDLSGVCTSIECGENFTGGRAVHVQVRPLIGAQEWTMWDLELQSGDVTDGVYTSELTLPASSKEGIWEVTVYLIDQLGNEHFMSTSELSSVPGSEGVTFVNTATSTSVLIERDWTLTGDSGSVTFPEGTEVTKDDNGSFAFYQMVNQPYDVHALPDNNRANAQNIVGVLRTGIPDLDLEFSQPVTIALNVPSHLNGRLLVIQSMRESGAAWNNETTCLVAAGVCEFTVFHATHFLASTSSSTSGTGGQSVLPDSWPNTGFQWQFDATRFPF